VKSLVITVITLAVVGAAHSAAHAKLIGVDLTGVLYDIDQTTGAASNPRSTGVSRFAGIAFGLNGTLYGLTTAQSLPANALVSIDPATGATTTIGSTGLQNISEGDLTVDPTTGIMYGGMQIDSGLLIYLFTVNPTTGKATKLSQSATADVSALAVAANGTMYAYDTNVEQFYTMNKTFGTTENIHSTFFGLGSTMGMTFDRSTGVLYIADGGTNGTNSLYRMNPSNGAAFLIGPTGITGGVWGLAYVPVPEPSALALLFGALTCFSVRPFTRAHRRRHDTA
jgi:hypothetical protein